jgi:hypothetical protein
MTAAARRALSSVAHFLSFDWVRKEPQPLYPVGDYCADYSELPTKEIGMRNPELDKLLNESKIVSTKR